MTSMASNIKELHAMMYNTVASRVNINLPTLQEHYAESCVYTNVYMCVWARMYVRVSVRVYVRVSVRVYVCLLYVN